MSTTDKAEQAGSDNYIFFEAEKFLYLMYHRACRALIGKANAINRFDDWEFICHHCKKIIHFKDVDGEIRFVRIEKKKD